MTEAHKREQLAQGCYAALSWCEYNPQPIDPTALPLLHCTTHDFHTYNYSNFLNTIKPMY